MDYDSAANNAIMNQLCKVCGEPAAGFHFGAFTCEGCKSFFGRTYNNISSISECKNNSECIINKKNRTACKACRLRKCLLVGMSKSGSRYGRRSNWFKIHCLLQEQQQHSLQALKTPFRPHPYISPFFHNARLPFAPPKDAGRLSPESEGEADERLKPVVATSPANVDSHKSLGVFDPASSVSPPSLPPTSPRGGGFGWPLASRGFWFPPPVPIASPAPSDQEQPMDLSKKCSEADGKKEDASLKAMPLDLTLDRPSEMT